MVYENSLIRNSARLPHKSFFVNMNKSKTKINFHKISTIIRNFFDENHCICDYYLVYYR